MNTWKKNDDETVTLDELFRVLTNHLGEDDTYSRRTLQRQLCEHYGDRVNITSSRQNPIIVTLSSNVKHIIQGYRARLTEDADNIEALTEVVGKYTRDEI